MKKLINSIIYMLVVFAILIIAGSGAIYLYREKDAKTVSPTVAAGSCETAAFCQSDELWKDDRLGDSEYKMSNSGCLTTCIASMLLMQGISVEGVPEINPGTLNEFFSENDVYDSEGNLQWDAAGEALNVEFTGISTSEIDGAYLDRMIGKNIYPIACVKVPSTGNYHFVLLTGSDDESFLCMDPMNGKGEAVSLSEYDNKIYSLRYCE
ncbi:MAG: hypothetical protein ACI4JB_03485 [Porcipelethomonas sp.]